jgi:phosphohistidine phosphatase SixA
MPPARIVLMRHAEKTGEEGDRGLSAAGVARAERLATWVPETFGQPDFLIAAADSPKSRRSNLTLEPLARAIGLAIDDAVENADFKALADRLLADPRYAGKRVVVAWHQGKVPKLARALGAPAGSYPEKWGREVFDRVLCLDYQGAAEPTVAELRQPF